MMPEEAVHLDDWGDRVIALYKTAMIVRRHIVYHLRYPKSPAFDRRQSVIMQALMPAIVAPG
jgi:hypothetical protein